MEKDNNVQISSLSIAYFLAYFLFLFRTPKYSVLSDYMYRPFLDEKNPQNGFK